MQAALEAVKALKASTDIYGSGAGGSSSVAYEDVQLPRLSSLKRSSTVDTGRKRPVEKPRKEPKGKDGKQKAADGDRDRRGSSPRHLPGSLVDTWRYTNGGKTLIVSGRAWSIQALAKHLGVSATGLCWPYVLCLATVDAARNMTRCDKAGKAKPRCAWQRRPRLAWPEQARRLLAPSHG